MELTDLLEVHAIERLKYRYMRCLDQKLWDEMEGCFAEDATASYGGGAYSFEGREAIMGFLRSSMDSTSFLSSHRVHHPEIDLTGPDEATGVWAMEDVVVEVAAGVTIRGAAFYTDRYVKAGGDWRIAHTGYKRTYEEIQPRGSVEGLHLTADWWATGGRSSLSG